MTCANMVANRELRRSLAFVLAAAMAVPASALPG